MILKIACVIILINDRDIFSDYILLDETPYKTYKNILIYGISCETFMGTKTLHFSFDEIDKCIKICDGIRYLVLFDCGWFNKIWDSINYIISGKSGVTDSIKNHFRRIKIDSSSCLRLKKYLFLFESNILVIQITSVVNKNNSQDLSSSIYLFLTLKHSNRKKDKFFQKF